MSTGFSQGFGENQKPSSKVLRPPGGGSSDIFGSDNPGTPRNVRNHMASNIFGSTQDVPVKNNGDARRNGKNADSYNRLFGESERPFTPAKNHLKSNIPLGGDNAGTKATNGNGIPTNGHTNGKIENNNAGQNGVSKTEEMNIVDGIAFVNGDNRSNSSSNTTSSIISPISDISTDTTGQSNKSTSSYLRSPRNLAELRNPVTGVGFAPQSYNKKRVLRKDGNPVTGEGYNGTGTAEVNTAIPALNGAKQVINKNRIPPGGFSSGLW